MAIKKLIEVALPLEEINAESAREKSIRHGHPSTLHLWWARRPLATARAVIWSSLVDDPSSHPEQFPTEEAQRMERERLFVILRKLVKWENSNDAGVLAEAKVEIRKSCGDEKITLLDPFAGGGAIPLEAQRLGLEAHAHDLNPVAVMINKAMIEIPPKFAGQSPVKSIKEDAADLNLDNAQMRETESSLIRSSKTVDDRILETYCHLLVPYIDREVDLKEIIWDEINIRGGTDSILVKASRKMQQNEQLITQWAPALLLMQLDNLLWREADEINIGELWKMLCTYCYLPRLAGFEVLQQAIQTGVNGDEYFAYAEGKADGKYFGLKYNQFIGMVDRSGFIVKQVTALKQLAGEREKRDIPVPPAPPLYPDDLDVIPPGPWTPPVTPPPMPEQPKNRHFGMTVTLDNTRVVRNVGNLMDEVINHLMNVDGAKVEIRLLVDAIMPDGTPAPVVRTVTENCRTLHVEDCGFDD